MTIASIDWNAWEIEEPTAEFVERVMLATRVGSLSDAPLGTRRGPPRAMTILAAAAILGVSLAGLAMVAREARRKELASGSTPAPSVDPDGMSVGAVEASGAVAHRSAENAPPIPATSTVIDRSLRDQVRAKLARSSPVGLVPQTGLVPSGAEPVQNLTAGYLQARIREDFIPLARSCYESALARIPGLRGRMVLDFVIVGDAKVGGIVDQAAVNKESDIADPEFTSCMRESMLSMVFAPPGNDGWVSVTYPFVFAPDDEEARDR